jgi:hypothetical protein
MLMELLGRRSPDPAQDVARRILGEDVTQFDFYAGPNGLDVIRIVAGEALGLALHGDTLFKAAAGRLPDDRESRWDLGGSQGWRRYRSKIR